MDNPKPRKNWLIISLQIMLVLAASGYLVFALTELATRPTSDVCKRVDVRIMDSSSAGFITREEIENILNKEKITLIGQPMEQINSEQVQKTLLKNAFIREATCYKSPNGCFNILIAQRLPLLRVMADNGDDYYIDALGKPMGPMGYSADLIVATGSISRNYAKNKLLLLGLFLRDNEFWNDQIEQAYVRTDGSVDLVPRVGSGLIHLGNLSEIDIKFRNLQALYEKVMPTIGWNKYAEINVEHTGQIICKRNKKE